MKYINDIETNVIKTNYILNSDSSPDKNNVVNGIWFDDENRRIMISRDLNKTTPHWCEVLTVCDIPKNENHEYNYNYNYNYNYYEYSYNYEYSYEYNYDYEYVYSECNCELVIETEDIPVYSPIDQEQKFTYNIEVPVVLSETEGYTIETTFSYTEVVAESIDIATSVSLSTEIQISEKITTTTEIYATTEASFTKNATLTTEYSYTEYKKASTEAVLTIPEVVYNSPYDTTIDVVVEDNSFTTNISTTVDIKTEISVYVFTEINININTELTNITGPADIYTEHYFPETEILTEINTEIEFKISEHNVNFTSGSATANINNYTIEIGERETEIVVAIGEDDLNSYVTTEKIITTETELITLYYSNKIYNTEILNIPTITDPNGLLKDESANLVLNIGNGEYKNELNSELIWASCVGYIRKTTPFIGCSGLNITIQEGDKFRLFFGLDYPNAGYCSLPTELCEQNYISAELISSLFNKLTLTITKNQDIVCSGCSGGSDIIYGTEYYTYSVGGTIGNALPSGLKFSDPLQKSKEYTFYVFAFGELSKNYTSISASGLGEGEITEIKLTAPGAAHPFFCYASPSYSLYMNNLGLTNSTLNNASVDSDTLSKYYNIMNTGKYLCNSTLYCVEMIAPKHSASEISEIIYNNFINNSEFCSVAIVSAQEFEIVKDLPFCVITYESERKIFVDSKETETCSLTEIINKEIEFVEIKGINIPNYPVTINSFDTEFSATNVPVDIVNFTGTISEFKTEISVKIPDCHVIVPEKTDIISITDYEATIKSYTTDFTYNYIVDISEYKAGELFVDDYQIYIPDYPVPITSDNPLIIHDYPVNIPAGTIKESNVKVTTEIDYITEIDKTDILKYEGPVTVSEIIGFSINATTSTEFCMTIPVSLTELVKTPSYNITENGKVLKTEVYDTRLKYYTENSETEIVFCTQDIEGLVGQPLFVETGTRNIITNAWIDKNETY